MSTVAVRPSYGAVLAWIIPACVKVGLDYPPPELTPLYSPRALADDTRAFPSLSSRSSETLTWWRGSEAPEAYSGGVPSESMNTDTMSLREVNVG